MQTNNKDAPFALPFVVVNHSLRLGRCVLLFWRQCRCLGSSV